MRDIGKNIRSIRISRGMTQDTLAQRLFVTRQTVSNYENGRSRPDIEMVLRVAEVLETDANTVIYGPPVPEDQRIGRKRLILAGAVLAALSLLRLLLRLAVGARVELRYVMVPHLTGLLLGPPVMLLLGWCAFQGLGLWGVLKPVEGRKGSALRSGVLVLLGLTLLLQLPYIVWMGVALWRALSHGSVNMIFPNIPVYTSAARWLLELTVRQPVVYCLPGALLWLSGFPKTKQ